MRSKREKKLDFKESPSYFYSMKALIIGATGRLGNALISHLDSEGWEISVLVRSTFKVKQRDKIKAIFKGDVLDADSLKEATGGIGRLVTAIPALWAARFKS